MQKPDHEGRPPDRLLRLQEPSDYAVLNRFLPGLDDRGGEEPTLLHLAEQWAHVRAPREGAGKDVCSCYCVLDRKVDADAADW